jgi:hypothetical protein
MVWQLYVFQHPEIKDFVKIPAPYSCVYSEETFLVKYPVPKFGSYMVGDVIAQITYNGIEALAKFLVDESCVLVSYPEQINFKGMLEIGITAKVVRGALDSPFFGV